MKLTKGRHYTFRYRGVLYVMVKYTGFTWTTFGHLLNFEHSTGLKKIPKDEFKMLDIREW